MRCGHGVEEWEESDRWGEQEATVVAVAGGDGVCEMVGGQERGRYWYF